jgi:IS5 family transposase
MDFDMKPIKKNVVQGDFLKPWLSLILDSNHTLYQLAKKINWKPLEDEFEQFFTDKGAPAKPVRLVVGIMMLQHMYDFSDERVVENWVENPYWQMFCGEQQLQKTKPIDPSSLPRWRKRIGKEGMNKILNATIELAVAVGAIKKKALKKLL